MKRIFITTIANQRTLGKCHYETDLDHLKYDGETAYPIVHLLRNNINEEDDIEVIYIDLADNPRANLDMLVEEIRALELKYHKEIKMTPIARGLEESETSHLTLFKELLLNIEDCSTIYADLTYGTKPTPMILSFALFWIELIRKYSDVASLVYGRIVWKQVIDENGSMRTVIDKANIYDVTDILKIINLSQSMESIGGDNIEKTIFSMLNIGEEN